MWKYHFRPCSSGVERILGKNEVMGSIPIMGFLTTPRLAFTSIFQIQVARVAGFLLLALISNLANTRFHNHG